MHLSNAYFCLVFYLFISTERYNYHSGYKNNTEQYETYINITSIIVAQYDQISLGNLIGIAMQSQKRKRKKEGEKLRKRVRTQDIRKEKPTFG